MVLNGTRSNLSVSAGAALLLGLVCITVATFGQQPAETAPAPAQSPAAVPVAGATAVSPPASSPAAETPAAESPPPSSPAAEAPAAESPPPATPAEKTPTAEAAPAEEKAVEAAEPPPDFTKLAVPAVAERLKLTDAQRAQVATLLTERTTALAAAEEPEQAKVLQESDQKLAAVLTAEQLAEFTKPKPEPRLRFQFRFERWADVLQWFAEQADLSLVLDAPPPGTFNYSDTRQYTPTEAIDLLNGVLLTKGYTLVRRGRMLLVINLKDGVPEGIVPKVSLDELDRRGKFELVTVAFPLGRRPAATVSSEISPLLSPQGKVVPLPATSQILVTDTAGIMRAIGAVIESIVEPPAVPAAAKPEPPVAAVYPIKPADPKSVVEVLTAMVPEAKIVLDEKADQIHVHAPPSQQALVKEVLEQMQAGHAPEKAPHLETYPVAEAGAKDLLKTLQTIVPDARLTLDQNTGKVVAWAVPGDQETIKATIEKLESERSPARIPQFEVYRLTKVEPDAALNLLKNILPDAKLAIDAQTRMLIAVAVPADQEVIRRTLSQLQPEKPAANIPELRYYPLALTLTPDSITALKKTVPQATIALEANGDRLMVVATPEEHEQIKATIGQIETAAFAKLQSKLIVYAVTLAQRKRFMAVLSSLQNRLPGIRVIEDAEPGELSVWAKPQQHEVLAEILGELKRDVPNAEKFELVTYPVRSADAANVLSVLQEMFPEAKLVLDEASGRVLAWTRPAEHAAIKAALERLDAEPAVEKRPRFEVYRIRGGTATELLASVGALVPGARLTVDPKTGNLIAWATPEDQDLLKAALGKLQRGEAGGALEDTPQLEVYRLTRADPTTTLTLLQGILPDAKLSIDAQSKSLIALAVPEDQRAIKAMLKQLQPEQPDPNAPELRFYPLTQKPPASLLSVLKNAAPQAQVTLEPDGKHLTVLASPADHAMIQKLVERVEETAPPEEKNKLVIYPVTPAQRKRFQAVEATLTAELPGIKVIADAEPGELAIWAKPTQHLVIGQIVEELKRDAPAGEKYELVAYAIKSADPASVLSVLENLFPNTRIVLDKKTRRLAVWTRPDEHQAIRSAIEQLDSGSPAETQDKVMVYPIRDADPTVAIGILQELLPDVKFQSDVTAGTIVATGRQPDQDKIKPILEQLQVKNSPENRPRLEVYPVDVTDATGLVTTLQPMVPKAQLTVDPGGGKLVAWGTPEDHETLKTAIEKLGHGGALAGTRQVEVYRLTRADPETTLALLQTLLPQAKLSTDPQTRSLVAVATLAEHRTIRGTLEQLQPEQPGPDAPELRIYPYPYPVEQASPPGLSSRFRRSWRSTLVPEPEPAPSLLTALQQLAPQAQFTLDAKGKRLLVVASPADHQVIQAALDQVAQGVALEEKEQLVAYQIATADPESVLTVMQDLFPDANFVLDKKTKRLVARAGPKDHEAIKSVLQQMDSGVPGDAMEKFMVYPVPGVSPTVAIAMLQELAPEAKFSSDATAGTIVVWARKSDHEVIAKAIEQMQAGPGEAHQPKIVSYPAGDGDPTAMQLMLQRLVPTAQVVADTKKRSLVVLATPKQHETLAAAVEKMSQKAPPGEEPTVAVYTLEKTGSTGSYYALRFLREAVPGATFTLGSEPGQLIAWARPKDHEQIKGLVEQMAEKVPPEKAPKLVVYPLKEKTAADAMQILQTAVPDAKLAVDANPQKLNAWATPSDHEVIQAIVAQIDVQEPPESAAVAKVYTLATSSRSGAYYTVLLLREAVPKATFTIGSDPSQLIAWAQPKDHETIEGLVEQMAQKAPPDKAPTLVVYTLKEKTATAAMQVLQAAVPDATFAVDPDPQKLNAWARPADQETIRDIVTKIDVAEPAESAHTMEVYTLRSTTAAGALAFLTSAFPGARFTAGANPRQLIVWARPAEHEKIKAAVQQMATEETLAKVYRFRNADPAATLSVLTTLVPEAQIALDATNQSLVVSAVPDDHGKIRAVIQEVEAAGGDRKLELHSLRNIDSYAALNVLEDVLETQGAKAELSIDSGTNQLVAIARPEEQELIRSTLQQLRTEERELEVFQLDFIEPATAELAITNLFRDEGLGNTPDVDSDPTTQQLFVRGTPQQLEEIRQLLVKLGETGLTSMRSGGSDRLRVIPFHGDAKAALAEIQRIWPQLRQNPIRVVTPSAVTPLLRESTQPVPPPIPGVAPKTEAPATSAPKPEIEAPAPPGAKGEVGESGDAGVEGAAEVQSGGGGAAPEAEPEKSQPDSGQTPPPDQPAPEAETEGSDEDKKQQPEPVAPVLVVLGDGSITIASEDPAALNQFESLLRSMMQRTGYSGRDFSIYTIQNANAVRVAATLTELFRAGYSTRTSSYGSSLRAANRVVIVPDERLNTILVKGSRADRAKIESLLKILDTAEISRGLKIIPLRKTNAERMKRVLDMILEDEVRLRPSRIH